MEKRTHNTLLPDFEANHGVDGGGIGWKVPILAEYQFKSETELAILLWKFNDQ